MAKIKFRGEDGILSKIGRRNLLILCAVLLIGGAVVLNYTAPVFVMAYSVAFLGEKFNLRKAVSVAMVMCGCAKKAAPADTMV